MPPASLAKTTRPRLADVLVRKRLFELLDQRRRAPVVWLSGPPGAGKTTLVASYLESCEVESRWYQLDAGDVDAGTFFFYLGEAVAGGDLARALPRFTTEHHGDLAAFTRSFFQRLYALLEVPFVLVLDKSQVELA